MGFGEGGYIFLFNWKNKYLMSISYVYNIVLGEGIRR